MICEEIIVLKAFSDIFVGIRVDNCWVSFVYTNVCGEHLFAESLAISQKCDNKRLVSLAYVSQSRTKQIMKKVARGQESHASREIERRSILIGSKNSSADSF